eukprot:7059042-Prymnesium_polylepis.1
MPRAWFIPPTHASAAPTGACCTGSPSLIERSSPPPDSNTPPAQASGDDDSTACAIVPFRPNALTPPTRAPSAGNDSDNSD